jgi:hypothetical protein
MRAPPPKSRNRTGGDQTTNYSTFSVGYQKEMERNCQTSAKGQGVTLIGTALHDNEHGKANWHPDISFGTRGNSVLHSLFDRFRRRFRF